MSSARFLPSIGLDVRQRPRAAAVVARGAVKVGFPFVGETIGGSHLSAIELLRNLDTTRYEPCVILHRGDGPLAALLREQGIRFSVVQHGQRIDRPVNRDWQDAVNLAALLPRLVRLIRKLNLGIVHTNDGRIHASWGLAAKLAGSRLVWHQRSDPYGFALRYLAPWLADQVVAVSEFARPRPGPISAAVQCSVIHSPFDTDSGGSNRAQGRAQLLAEIGAPADCFVVGFVGQLIARKRPLFFVDTVAELIRVQPNKPIAGVLLGESFAGFDRAVVRRAAELGVVDHIHVLGFRHPVEPWLASLDVLAVTAIDEPFGRTLIEAMLAGVPVVATRSGGNPEAIVDGVTGRLVDPWSPSSFAAALEELIPSERRALLAAAARAEACSRFGVRRHVEAIMGIYDQVIGS